MARTNYVTAHNAQLRQYHHTADTPYYQALADLIVGLGFLERGLDACEALDPDGFTGLPDEHGDDYTWDVAAEEVPALRRAANLARLRLDSNLVGGTTQFLLDMAPGEERYCLEDDQGDEEDTPLETPAERAATEQGCSPAERPPARPTRWLDRASPNRAYHAALRDYVAALSTLWQAVDKVRGLDADGYATQRALTKELGWQDGEDFGCLEQAWRAAVECSAAVEPLLSNWLVPHVEGFLYGDIDDYCDECMREEDEYGRRVWAEKMHGDEDADEPAVVGG